MNKPVQVGEFKKNMKIFLEGIVDQSLEGLFDDDIKPEKLLFERVTMRIAQWFRHINDTIKEVE